MMTFLAAIVITFYGAFAVDKLVSFFYTSDDSTVTFSSEINQEAASRVHAKLGALVKTIKTSGKLMDEALQTLDDKIKEG